MTCNNSYGTGTTALIPRSIPRLGSQSHVCWVSRLTTTFHSWYGY